MQQLRLVLLLALVTAGPVAAQQRQLSTPEQVAHVLSRLTFGAHPGDIERVTAMGVDAWIAEQLRPASLSDSVAVAASRSIIAWSTPIADVPALSSRNLAPVTITNARPVATKSTVDVNGRRMDVAMNVQALQNAVRVRLIALRPGGLSDQLVAGKVIRAQLSERQLEELMADFWENHFSIYSAKQPSLGALPMFSRDAIRPRALGKFRDLLGAVAHSPAMLFYLDNHLSTAAGINENYARELLELHTMGASGGYTQDDVIAVARALTGWTIDPPRALRPVVSNDTPARFAFADSMHDREPKTVLGHTLAAGRGIEDGEQVLDILARHPSTARYIATKLARRFVSDEPPAAVIDRAAATFMRTDGDIAEVLRTIVTSDEFFSRAAFRAKVKTPFELVVSARRAFGIAPDTTVATGRLIGQFGQPLFGRDTPDGWPDVGTAWMNSGTIMRRTMFAGDIAGGRIKEFSLQNWDGWARLETETADVQADAVLRIVLAGVAEPATVAALRATTGYDKRARLMEMVALALGSPEFQRR